jgi:hypothetical protein
MSVSVSEREREGWRGGVEKLEAGSLMTSEEASPIASEGL